MAEAKLKETEMIKYFFVRSKNSYRFLFNILCIGILLFLTYPAQGQDSKTLERVQSLKTPFIKNKIVVYYSPGYKKRAKEVQRLIENAMLFYEQKLNLKVDLSVAVLTRQQWEQVTKTVPYDVPWVSDDVPHIAFLPATYGEGVLTSGGTKSLEPIPAAILQKLKLSGFSIGEALKKNVDLIGLHELGHTYAAKFGIFDARTNKWFNEFMANYFAYAYMREMRPKWATIPEVNADRETLNTPKQKYTTLEDFERLYFGVGPENYGWYQSMFYQRVAQVYDAKGLSFIEEVGKAFPLEEKETLSVNVVLQRLERIVPGFIKWSKTLGEQPNREKK